MVEYKCKKCKRVFDRKSRYDDHINRKIDCIDGKYTYKFPKLDHTCEHCEKSFSRRDSLKRHLKICQNIVTNQTMIVKGNNNNNVGCNNHITYNGDINNNFTINIFPFAKDGIESLTTEDKLDILLSKQGPTLEIICKVNFDTKKPCHHNMYIADIKSPYSMIYDGEKWVRMTHPNLVYDIVRAKKVDIENIFEEMKEHLTDEIVNSIRDMLKKLDLCDQKFFKRIMIYIKPILYDNRDMVVETQRKQKKFQKSISGSHDDKYINCLKGGITVLELDEKIKEKHKIKILCSDMKKEATYLLRLLVTIDRVDSCDIKNIQDQINNSNDPSSIKSVIGALSKGFTKNVIVDHFNMLRKIDMDKQINSYLK